ncbi:Thymidylate synthase [compost metagenome]
MRQYLDFLQHILDTGEHKDDRTATGTLSIFGYQMRFDISGFNIPWITTKLSHPKSIVRELKMFIMGTGEIDYLAEHDVTIWDEWVKAGTRVYNTLTVGERMERVRKNKEEVNAAFDAYRESLYSVDEVEGWEFMPLSGKYRAPDINDLLHAWIDTNTKIGRQKLVKGDLGPIYGVQWRKWPLSKETRPLSRRSAARAVEAIGKFDELKTKFADEFALDLWLMKAGGTEPFTTENADDSVVLAWLADHGHALTEEVTVSSIDQIAKAIHKLKTDPNSRSIIVSAWNPAELADMALEPCHTMFQFYSRYLNHKQLIGVIKRSPLLRVAMQTLVPADAEESALYDVDRDVLYEFCVKYELPTRGLSCQLYQRSADALLGVPFNISSYALLTKMFAQVVGMEPIEFIWTGGDCHIYNNHMDQVKEQLSREPFEQPQVLLNAEVTDIDQFEFKDIQLINYQHHPAIPAPKAV